MEILAVTELFAKTPRHTAEKWMLSSKKPEFAVIREYSRHKWEKLPERISKKLGVPQFRREVRTWTDANGVHHTGSEVYISPQEWLKFIFSIPIYARLFSTWKNRLCIDGAIHDLIDSPHFNTHPLIRKLFPCKTHFHLEEEKRNTLFLVWCDDSSTNRRVNTTQKKFFLLMICPATYPRSMRVSSRQWWTIACLPHAMLNSFGGVKYVLNRYKSRF